MKNALITSLWAVSFLVTSSSPAWAAPARPAQPARPAAEQPSDTSSAEDTPPSLGDTPEKAARPADPNTAEPETAPPPAGPLPGATDTAPPKALDKPSQVFGVGLNYQFLIVPQFFLKAFLRAAKSDDHNLYRHGFGAHFLRRKGNLDIVVRLMFGFMMSKSDDGNWLGRGHDWDELDYTEFHDLNFLWADVTFIYNWEIFKNFYIGAGGGIGLGWVMGKVYTTESYYEGTPGSPCSGSNYDNCRQCHPSGVSCSSNSCPRDGLKTHPNREKAKVPPVLPALNGVLSLRYDIWRHLSARLTTGIFLPGMWMMDMSVEWLF